MAFAIQIEDPNQPDIIELLKTHLQFTASVTPSGSGHAFDLQKLRQSDITFWTARDRSGVLLGCIALKQLAHDQGEIKSMHTSMEARGQGVGSKLLKEVIRVALGRSYTRLSLETGNHEAFMPSQKLYEKMGFVRCPPFGPYKNDPFSLCMSKTLGKQSA